MKKSFCIYILLFFALSIKSQAQQNFMMQGWYWDFPKTNQGASWVDTINLKAKELSQAGFTDIWLPPLSVTNSGAFSNGYDVKDLFNLGSNSFKTGFGTRTKIDALVSNFNNNGLRVMGDMVYNHRDGGQLEINEAVAGWIKNYNLTKHNNGDRAYPSDRVIMAIPVGGNTGRGAGNYYFKIRSASMSNDYYNKPYGILVYTGKVGKKNIPDRNETANNGGGDCAQPFDTVKIGVTTLANIDNGGCGIDEFLLELDSLDFNNGGDKIFVSVYNLNSDYADQYIYGLWDATNSLNLRDTVQYYTRTKFVGTRGQMSKLNFKPNGNPTCLCGDYDAMDFFYDYDQNVPATRDTLFEWTKWMWTNVGLRGFRVDAVKHFSPQFVGDMLDYLHNNSIDPPIYIGEYFDYNPFVLKGWVDNVKASMNTATLNAIKPAVFDFSLQGALRDACDAFGYDARNVFSSGVVDGAGGNPENVGIFVNNHDFRTSAQAVDNDRLLAYAYILTNNKVGTPCVYYSDYYDTTSNVHPNKIKIDKLIAINKKYISNSSNREYLNRFGTGFSSNFISGASSNSLIYQLRGGTSGCGQNKDAIVAINFSGNQLQVDHQVNTGANYNLSVGDTLIDMLGNSAFPYAIVNANAQIYMQLPARSYSVWVKGGLTKTPSIVSFGATTICAGDSVLLTAGNGSPCYDYQWQLNNVDIPGATASNFYAKQSGSYSVKASQGGVLPKLSNALVLTASAPSIPFVTFQNDTLFSSAANQYQWFYSADSITYSIISGATLSNYIVGVSGYYKVRIADGSGCSALSNGFIVNLTSVSDISDFNGISIRPNPSIDGKFQLNTSNPNLKVEWIVYNTNGEIIASEKQTKSSSQMSRLIDISNQPGGIYYLKLNVNSETRTIKIVKQ